MAAPTISSLADPEKTLLAQYLATKGIATNNALAELNALLGGLGDGQSIYSLLAPLLPNGIPLSTNWLQYMPLLNGGAVPGSGGGGNGGGQGGQGTPGGKNYEAAEPFAPGGGGSPSGNVLSLVQSLFKPIEAAPDAAPGTMPQFEQTYFPVQQPPAGGFMDIEPLFPDTPPDLSTPIGTKMGTEAFGPPNGYVSDSGLISRDVKTVPIGANGLPVIEPVAATRTANLPDAQYGFDGAMTPADPNAARLTPSNGGFDLLPETNAVRPEGPVGALPAARKELPNAAPQGPIGRGKPVKDSATVSDSTETGLGGLFTDLGGAQFPGKEKDDLAAAGDGTGTTRGISTTKEALAEAQSGGLSEADSAFGGSGSNTLTPSVRPVLSMPLDPLTGQPQYDLAAKKAADATLAGTFKGALAGPEFFQPETVDQMYGGILPQPSLESRVDARLAGNAGLDAAVSELMNYFKPAAAQGPPSTGAAATPVVGNAATGAPKVGSATHSNVGESFVPSGSSATGSAAKAGSTTTAKVVAQPAANPALVASGAASAAKGATSTKGTAASSGAKAAAPAAAPKSTTASKGTSATSSKTTTSKPLNRGML